MKYQVLNNKNEVILATNVPDEVVKCWLKNTKDGNTVFVICKGDKNDYVSLYIAFGEINMSIEFGNEEKWHAVYFELMEKLFNERPKVKLTQEGIAERNRIAEETLENLIMNKKDERK